MSCCVDDEGGKASYKKFGKEMVDCFEDDDDDDDPSAWVAIEPNIRLCRGGQGSGSEQPDGGANVPLSNEVIKPVDEPSVTHLDREGIRRSFHGDPLRSTDGGASTNGSLTSVRRALEAKQLLRGNLVEHPLSQCPGKFASHFISEVFCLDVHVRVGILLILIGSLLQAMALIHVLVSHKKTIFFALIFFVSYMLVHRADKKVLTLIQTLSSLNSSACIMEAVFTALESFDFSDLKHAFLVLAVVPSLLEMRTIIFLTNTVLEGGWIAVTATAASMHTLTTYFKMFGAPSRDCSIRSMICLYTSALLVAIIHVKDLRRMNALVAPFILAAGSMLLYHRGGNGEYDRLGRAAREALRLTLRDILVELKGNVAEDEMLQLAILRWIADYWGTNSDVSSSHSRRSAAEANLNRVNEQSPFSGKSSSPSIKSEDMTKMLQITTKQMRQEVTPDALRLQSHRTDQSVPFETSNDTSHSPPHQEDQSEPSERSNCTGGSLDDLYSMLTSMDIDSRAKPAVQAYKASVQRIPPGRTVALLVALSRRCPAIISLAVWSLVRSEGRFRAFLQTTVTMLPLILLEISRVKEWTRSCVNASSDPHEASNASGYWLPPPSISDNIFIMMCPDQYDPYNPPQLIQVWSNVQSSVVSLERSILAIRCVQTTSAATELTFSLLSLARLGVEISENGWEYGLRVLANDIMQFTRRPRKYGHCSGYTAAAVSAFKNGQTIGKNIKAIMEEDEGNKLVRCIADVVAASLGCGWIWDMASGDSRNPLLDGSADHKDDTSAETAISNSTGMLTPQKRNVCLPLNDVRLENSVETRSTEAENSLLPVCSSTKKTNKPSVNKCDDLNLPSGSSGSTVVNDTHSTTIEPAKVSNVPVSTKHGDTDAEGDDSSWTEIRRPSDDIEEFSAPASSVPRENKETVIHSSSCDKINDEWVKWAGGGIALAVAIVGGIVVANVNKEPTEECQARREIDSRKDANSNN